MTERSETLQLRSSTPADREFLIALYASTRQRELAEAEWTPQARDAFARMQFDLQDRHYRTVFPRAQYSLIVSDGRPIGRLIVDRGPLEIRVVDISLLPEHRGHGIGSALLNQVLAEAALAGVPVRLSVDIPNPARRLYERLGFEVRESSGPYLLLERAPPSR